MNLIDTHCHLAYEKFDQDRKDIITRAKTAGVEKIISIGCHLQDVEKTLKITAENNNVFAAVGLHPGDAKGAAKEDFEKIAALARHEKVVAIGETGFDFYWPENPSYEEQLQLFQKHVVLAQELKKPLIIHSRSAKEETLSALKTVALPFVWHCFSEDMNCAEQIFEFGGMISFTGIVTFPKSKEIQEIAKSVPLEKIMIETDAPFLAPVPQRGKRCESAFVKDTAAFIAELRGVDVNEFAKETTKNAERFFQL